MRRLLITLIVVGLLGALLYSQRVAILDLLVAAQKEATLPEEVGFEQVQEAEEEEEEIEKLEIEEADEAEETEGTEGTEEIQPTPEPQPSPEPEGSSRLSEMNLAVPFTSQAPNGDWGEPYQEACEEASIYMVHQFYEGEPAGQIDPQVADEGIWEIVNFENALFGFYKDTTAAQTAVLAEQMYGYGRVDVISDPTVEDIKTHVAAGRPVIIPAAGRELGNPFFTSPGPLYHMLVVKGYTETQFITNDPGTRRGASYVYDFDTIMNAMHDWNDGDVENGAKAAIVIYPNE
jgi:hypothetical protein